MNYEDGIGVFAPGLFVIEVECIDDTQGKDEGVPFIERNGESGQMLPRSAEMTVDCSCRSQSHLNFAYFYPIFRSKLVRHGATER